MSTSSTRSDLNYFSISGGFWAKFETNGTAEPVPFPENGILDPVNRLDYTALMKISGGEVVKLSKIMVAQARESAVDINNHANVDLSGVFGSMQNGIGDQIFSVKGGSIAKISGSFCGSGKRLSADVIVDQWSDQSLNGSTVDLTDSSHVTSRKIKVVKRYGASKVTGQNIEVLVLNSMYLTAYWWIKYAIRAVMRIPVGKKGPSWI